MPHIKELSDSICLTLLPLFERTDEVVQNPPLEQEASVNIKSTARKTSFLRARLAAHIGIAKLGNATQIETTAILRGLHGEPLFPKGIIGSLSHSNELACALVSKDPQIRACGVDCEPISRVVSKQFFKRICNAEEIIELERMAVTALEAFVIKESALKAVFTIQKSFPDFRSLSLSVVSKDAESTAILATSPNLHTPINISLIAAYNHHISWSVIKRS